MIAGRRPHPHARAAAVAMSARKARKAIRTAVAVTPAPPIMRSVDVSTLPYPGIATDYKPFFVAMLAVAEGVGIVTENLSTCAMHVIASHTRVCNP